MKISRQSHGFTVDEAQQMVHNAVLAALTTNEDFHYVEDDGIAGGVSFALYDESGENEVHGFVQTGLL